MWAGLDLAAKPDHPTGIAIGADWASLQVCTAFADGEILSQLAQAHAIWIDAPLTAGEGPFRACDRALHQRGIAILPLTWPAMRRLHQRAISLRQRSMQTFYETFPWSLYRYLGQQSPKPRPIRKDLELLATWARKQGFRAEPASPHEWDAVACWAIGWLAQRGQAYPLTGPDGALWVPA